MSIHYTGKAAPVAQVSSVDVGTYDASAVYSLTISGVSVTATAAGSINETAAALAAAWNASTHPYFTPITASVDTSASPNNTILMTADEAGFPFGAVTATATGSGTFGAVTTPTVATGPNHWSAADNWSGGYVPDVTDEVLIDRPDARLCWDLDQSGSSPTVLLARLTTRGDARIGLSSSAVATTANGESTSTAAPEYRADYLKLGITDTRIEPDQNTNTPSGSRRIKIDNQATGASTTVVAATGNNSVDPSQPAVRFLASSANWDLFIESARGGVGVGVEASETATVGDLAIVDVTSVSQLIVGDGVTHSTVVQQGGRLELDAAATMPAITINGGTAILRGTQAITALTVNGGNVQPRTKGTITTLTQAEGIVDWTRQQQARTVTTYNFNGGERRIDHDVVTITNDNRAARKVESVEAL